MELSDLENLIKGRRSIRRWQERDVPEETLLKAIELATWAPNGGNQQVWHYYVILNRGLVRAVAQAVEARQKQIASWPEAEKFGMAAAVKPSFIRGAPAAIAVAAARYESPADRVLAAREKVDAEAVRIRRYRNVANSRIQSVSSGIAYLLLVLHQMGLGAVWMTGPIQAKEEIEKLLRVPPELDVVAFIPVGYPAESPSKERKPIGEVCQVIR